MDYGEIEENNLEKIDVMLRDIVIMNYL